MALKINKDSRISLEQEKRAELRKTTEEILKDIDALKQKVEELLKKI